MLLRDEEIRAQLDEVFLPLEPNLSGFRLVKSRIANSDLEQCESDLGLSFPDSFESLLTCYNFDDLTMGPIAFLNGGNYLKRLTDSNLAEKTTWEDQWWGEGDRPHSIIIVAYSDPYSITLNCTTGTVSALVSDDGWHGKETVVAEDFGLFFRGLGTLVVKRFTDVVSMEFTSLIAKEVGSSEEGIEFWQWLGM